MKTSTLKNMLLRNMLTAGALIASLAFGACNKDNDTPDSSVTSLEAGQVMAQAIDPESGGIVLITEFSANVSLNNAFATQCGVKKDTTVSGQITLPNRSFAYNLSWSRQLFCTGNTPSSITHVFSGSSSYSLPVMSSNDNTTGSFTITGLEPSNSQLTVAQTYMRTGTQQLNAGTQRGLLTNVKISSDNLKIDKATRMIVSGTAAVNVTGQVSSGETFSYSGIVTFLGGRKANLTVSGGSAFDIQW